MRVATEADTAYFMGQIQALDPSAVLQYSYYTNKFFVNSSLEIGDGVMLTGISEHHEDSFEAAVMFWGRICKVEYPNYVVGRYLGQRREWRWNGIAFAECTRAEVLGK